MDSEVDSQKLERGKTRHVVKRLLENCMVDDSKNSALGISMRIAWSVELLSVKDDLEMPAF